MNDELELEMAEVLRNEVVDRHSYFQLKYFVIGKEPTLQSMLWRCVRELQARKESMDAIVLEIENVKDKVELLNIDEEEFGGQQASSEFESRRNQIIARQRSRQRESLRRTVEGLERKRIHLRQEADFFIKSFKSLEKKEKIKSFDDHQSQSDYWNEKLSQDVSLKMLTRQPLDLELMKTVLALDDATPVKAETTRMFSDVQRQALEAARPKTSVE